MTNDVQEELVNSFLEEIQCSGSDTSCLNSASLSSIINATSKVYASGQEINAAAGVGEPIRVVNDGSFITTPLDSNGAFPHVEKPLLISNVKNEATATVYFQFNGPTPNSVFEPVCQAILGMNRTKTIVDSNIYPLNLSDGSEDSRIELEEVGTDQMWKCPSWTFARNWSKNGGTAYVAEYTLGATYPSNDQFPICSQVGQVCHQDDIELVVCPPSYSFTLRLFFLSYPSLPPFRIQRLLRRL